ncbi:hypothetical protein TNCV_1478301 [Trichonephila clavipes]|nr:hypothetical protein TNCV_1478301 [Trichonephila clavipes]
MKRSHRRGLSPDEVANLLREHSENESDGGELPCSNLDYNEGIRLSESDCEESEESAHEIDSFPVNLDIYVSKHDTHNINLPGIFATRNVLRQISDPTSFTKIMSPSVFYDIKELFLCYLHEIILKS